jgi:hypothetical protein
VRGVSGELFLRLLLREPTRWHCTRLTFSFLILCYLIAQMQTATTRQAVVKSVAAPDTLTVASIAIFAYVIGNVLHEGAGHGGACLLSGARPLVLSSVHFECSVENRLVMAGGTLANFIAAGLFFALGRLSGLLHPRWRSFCSCCLNLRWYIGPFVGHQLASKWNDDSPWAACGTNAHKEKLAIDRSGLRHSDRIYRCTRPERSVRSSINLRMKNRGTT